MDAKLSISYVLKALRKRLNLLLSAEDIEQRVTLPFEQLLHARLADVKMISSTTGAGFSATLLRFNSL